MGIQGPRGWVYSYHIPTIFLGVPSFGSSTLSRQTFTWKWRAAPYKIAIICKRPSMSFHVTLGKGRPLGVCRQGAYLELGVRSLGPAFSDSLPNYLDVRAVRV